MRVEVSISVNFVMSFLYNRLPRRRVHLLGEHLDSSLVTKFQGHWYPEQPLKGTAYRCLKIAGEQSDPIIIDAAKETGLDAGEVMQHLPQNLTLWFDPGEVSCRVGEKGHVTQLYSADVEQHQQDQQQHQHQHHQYALHQEEQQQQQLQSTVPAVEQPANAAAAAAASCFTAAAFAQTKFGSTKLRQPTRAPRHHPQAWGPQSRSRQQQQQQQQQQLQQQQHLQQLQQQQQAAAYGYGYDYGYGYGYGYDSIWSCGRYADAAGYNSSGGLLSVGIPASVSSASAKVANGGGSGGYGSDGSSGHSSPLMMSMQMSK